MHEEVAIILSTYNGENYIDEQMKSLLNQSYKNIEIFIHDDGSKDSTVDIVKRYSEEYPNVHFYEDKTGLGYPKCFISLLDKVKGYKYYAFCDQDDVWYSDKILEAVQILDRVNCRRPILYYTAVEYCDSELNYIRSSRFSQGKKNIMQIPLQSLLLGGEAMGMTFVFNAVARNALLEANKCDSYKDWFLKIYCAACGEVYYNPNASAKYRRHEMAVTNKSNPADGLARYIGQFKDIFINKDGFSAPKKVINYLNNIVETDVLNENRELIKLFSMPNNIKKRMYKVFWRKRFRLKLRDELGYRIAFFLGRI